MLGTNRDTMVSLLLVFSFPLLITTVESYALINSEHVNTIAQGQVAVIPEWLPPDMIQRMRKDAVGLFEDGYFTPDGLTNTALSKDQQGFSRTADRQTFRGGAGWDDPKAGDSKTRKEFDERMRLLRADLAQGLGRETLIPEGVRKHESTFNLYLPGALLGRHLDEHHEGK